MDKTMQHELRAQDVARTGDLPRVMTEGSWAWR